MAAQYRGVPRSQEGRRGRGDAAAVTGTRELRLQPPVELGDPGPDVVVRRRADPARRRKLVRLLSILLDSPATPGERR